jgi:uncharacterized protein Yka (UPF0111/DUF47 family)
MTGLLIWSGWKGNARRERMAEGAHEHLERFNKLFVGREPCIDELKEKIERFKEEIDEMKEHGNER